MLLVLWLGPAWGALPIYLANLAGEEFVVLMPHTSRAEIGEVAERVRSAVAGEPLAAGGGSDQLAPTISVGAAAAVRPPFDSVALVQSADEACYEAKRLGRNRVVVAEG